MKIFCTLFAFYILSLCAYPCQDNGEHGDYASKKIEKAKTCSGHEDESCSHKCSPFCFCNCCQVNTVVTVPIHLQDMSTIPQMCFTPYIVSPLPEIALSIWQPPKIL